MAKMRLSFTKDGCAKYISHLDLVRTMGRAFVRAGMELRHSQGFNPHPLLTFALPLSVGQESECELLDFETVEDIDDDAIKRLNKALPSGLWADSIYQSEKKFKHIKWLAVSSTLKYDSPLTNGVTPLKEHFAKGQLIVNRRTKRGEEDTDIRSMIKSIDIEEVSSGEILIKAVIAAQNPTLNPNLLITAAALLPEYDPDSVKIRRIALFDDKMESFQ